MKTANWIVIFLISVSSVFAQGYQYPMMGYGMMGRGGMWGVGLLGLFYFTLLALIFSIIFWWTYKRMVDEKKHKN